MLTEDQQLDLEKVIYTWLDTIPDSEAILEYATNLPEDESYVVYTSAVGFLRLTFERRFKYFTAANCEEFVEDVKLPDQIEAFDHFTKYNASSVLNKLGATYPSVTHLILPADISAWSKQFLAKVEGALQLLTAREFSQTRLYADSLQKGHTREELATIKTQLESLFLKEGEAFDAGRALSQVEIDEWHQFYKSLKFLPDEQVEFYASIQGYFERFVFNTALIDALAVLSNATETTNIDKALWDVACLRMLKKVLAQEEANRIAASSKGKELTEFYNRLDDVWTEEGILNGQTLGETQQILAEAQAKGYPIRLSRYLAENLTVEAALDPLDADLIIANIIGSRNDAEAEVYITQVADTEGFELDQRALLKSLLHQMTQLLRHGSHTTNVPLPQNTAPAV
jgi:hypothetical protein